MKVYARQIAPEYQESPLFMGDEFFPDNIAVCGNRDYHSQKPELFENVQNVLEQGELAENVVLYAFAGYTRTPQYREVE